MTLLAPALAVLLAACQPEGQTAQLGSSSDTTPSPAASPAQLGVSAVPAASPPPQGVSLELSKTVVHPGEIITRTIRGSQPPKLTGNDFRSDLVGPVMMLEQKVKGEWRLIYYLGIGYGSQKPGNFRPGPNVAISAIGLETGPATIKIPELPPGSYRLREDLQREDDLTPMPATPSPPVRTYTLYATIQVVSPSS